MSISHTGIDCMVSHGMASHKAMSNSSVSFDSFYGRVPFQISTTLQYVLGTFLVPLALMRSPNKLQNKNRRGENERDVFYAKRLQYKGKTSTNALL